MDIPFLDLSAQSKQIEKEVISMITEVISNSAFVGGPQVSEFENEFSEYCETDHCVGVNSGTDALRFALMAVGVGNGDEVITVPNTFIATTEAVSQVGAKPVFVDVDPHTCNMDFSKIKERISKKTKAIIPVHLYGQPADMDPILEIAKEGNIAVIEDACQAHGATYKNTKVGSIGTAGCFSFYPGKNLGAFGEGGAIVTSDKNIADKAKMIRDHGQSRKYYHDIEGYNGRLDTIQAGVLRIKLRKLSQWNEARKENAAYYKEQLSKIAGVQLITQADYASSVFHLYVIQVDGRDALQTYLTEKKVATGLHYPLPLHLQKAYAHLGYKEGDFPITEKIAKRLVSLPMYPELTRGQIGYVAHLIAEFMER